MAMPPFCVPQRGWTCQHAEQWGYHVTGADGHDPQVASAATSVVIATLPGHFPHPRRRELLPNHAPLVIAEQFGTPNRFIRGDDLGPDAPGGDQLTARAPVADLAAATPSRRTYASCNACGPCRASRRAPSPARLNVPPICRLEDSSAPGGGARLPSHSHPISPRYLDVAPDLYRQNFVASATGGAVRDRGMSWRRTPTKRPGDFLTRFSRCFSG
jgi:hypothetical protein